MPDSISRRRLPQIRRLRGLGSLYRCNYKDTGQVDRIKAEARASGAGLSDNLMRRGNGVRLCNSRCSEGRCPIALTIHIRAGLIIISGHVGDSSCYHLQSRTRCGVGGIIIVVHDVAGAVLPDCGGPCVVPHQVIAKVTHGFRRVWGGKSVVIGALGLPIVLIDEEVVMDSDSSRVVFDQGPL